ncbi:uncharacterized protein PV07_02723 [Cladophialophora immunda]|uniref:BTB domain-containing protein n=1 Tax=Cladophialophora immunda TaxID=569365 RepID=A0A0D2D5V0_9EURO|nr:uncharacterized protein PV07_02723 [Cladophialophora immunda]KIW31039.1 hypothetical protein PV07_02723 [Cladophialophora immunda]OQV05910.1 hypothetical protein CLAIMM_10566 [Cladophialophora immunda]
MSICKPRPTVFTESPTISVTASGTSWESRVHHIHRALLEGQSMTFCRKLTNRCNKSVRITVGPDVRERDFGCFVTWLYNREIPEDEVVPRFCYLWQLAILLESQNFKSYLEVRGKACLRGSDYLFPVATGLLELLFDDDAITHRELYEYLIQGLADKINADGWVRFITKTDGGWEHFMNHKDDKNGTKGKVLSMLMERLDKGHQENMQA